jgi:hypothetical protein
MSDCIKYDYQDLLFSIMVAQVPGPPFVPVRFWRVKFIDGSAVSTDRLMVGTGLAVFVLAIRDLIVLPPIDQINYHPRLGLKCPP